ncbi:MAG: sel1 repeat family protein [Desulfobacterales bacterium]|nr:sel1 repeat family protein [Desulfobacterales bacterium]
MKQLSFIITGILIAFFISSCSQKLPVPTSDDTGVLIIPTKIQNRTAYSYIYYYSLLYSPELQLKIDIFPKGNEKFFILDNFPSGKYQINGLEIISIPQHKVTTSTSSTTVKAPNPIDFEIKPKQVTMLDFIFWVEQKYVDSASVEQFYQNFGTTQIDATQRDKLYEELRGLPNAELWDLTQLGAKYDVDQYKTEITDYYNNSIIEYAQQGYSDAQYNLGLIYENGEGVPQSDKKAAQWYRKAAEQGYPAAKNKLEILCGKIPEACK